MTEKEAKYFNKLFQIYSNSFSSGNIVITKGKYYIINTFKNIYPPSP